MPQDGITAYMWMDLAAARGFTEAADSRDFLGSFLTDAQIAEARRRANAWSPTME